MKVYFINNHINVDKLEKYNVKNKDINYIYTEEGIFIFEKSRLFNTVINDESSKYSFFKNYNIFVNNSEILKGDEVMQIPVNNIQVKNTIKEYKLRNNALVKLIIEYENNKIDKWYFDIPDLENIMIQEDIYTFLSLIY